MRAFLIWIDQGALLVAVSFVFNWTKRVMIAQIAD
jgi:hypothetical protein